MQLCFAAVLRSSDKIGVVVIASLCGDVRLRNRHYLLLKRNYLGKMHPRAAARYASYQSGYHMILSRFYAFTTS